MKAQGSCVIAGNPGMAGVPVPTRPVPSGRDILSDLARKHSRRPVIVLAPEPDPDAGKPRRATERPAPTGTGAKWVPEHDKARMIQLYRDGKMVKDIAAELGLFSTTVRRHLKASGIPMRDDREQTPKATKARAVAECLAGESESTVARRYGVHASTVHAWIVPAGGRPSAAA